MFSGMTQVDRLEAVTWLEREGPFVQHPVLNGTVGAPFEIAESAAVWAERQWGAVQLGDVRLNRRAVQMGAVMAAQPGHSLPRQMASRAALRAAYGLLNDRRRTMEQLSGPHWEQTRQAAGEQKVVLWLQDTTELDYTHHPTKEGLAPIGDGRGRGVLLHTTLGVVPSESPQVLGVAHQKAVLRCPAERPRPKYTSTPEGLVWADAAEAVGAPPKGVLWIHVGDGGSDDFRFMHTCRNQDKHFLLRVTRNRILAWDEESVSAEKHKIRDFARTLPVQHRYVATLPARSKRPARKAQLCLAWTAVTIPPPQQGPIELRQQAAIRAWVLRIWEVDAPPEVEEPVEWFLLTSVPTQITEEALTRIQWYLLRWLTEDYHQCLKTGCAIEKRQLDHADDIRRLLGFLGPIAARLLQMRNLARAQPNTPAKQHIDSLTIAILAQRLDWPSPQDVTMHTFWRGVARLGGHLGRRGDGPPGWRTTWYGWQLLQDLVSGARLYAELSAQHGANST